MKSLLELWRTFQMQIDSAGIDPLLFDILFSPLWNIESRMETKQPYPNANALICRRKRTLPLG